MEVNRLLQVALHRWFLLVLLVFLFIKLIQAFLQLLSILTRVCALALELTRRRSLGLPWQIKSGIT